MVERSEQNGVSDASVDDVVTDAEVEKALENWHPWWKRPVTPGEWDKIVEQRARFAASAFETHRDAVESMMPFWFIQRAARNKYVLIRKYQRTRRRAEIEKSRMAKNLLHAIGFGCR